MGSVDLSPSVQLRHVTFKHLTCLQLNSSLLLCDITILVNQVRVELYPYFRRFQALLVLQNRMPNFRHQELLA